MTENEILYFIQYVHYYRLYQTTLERIYDFQFMYIVWFLVVYLTYFKKPIKETTFSSKIHKAFFANIRNDCVFSVIEKKAIQLRKPGLGTQQLIPFSLTNNRKA